MSDEVSQMGRHQIAGASIDKKIADSTSSTMAEEVFTDCSSETAVTDLNNAAVNTEFLLAYCSTDHYICHVIEVLDTSLLRRTRGERPLLQSSINLLFCIVAIKPRLYLWALPSRRELAVDLFA